MTRTRSKILMPVVVAMTAALTGCSDSSAELPDLPQGASQPFELFRSDLMVQIQDAQRQLQADCMSGKGFPQLQEGLEVSSNRPFMELTQVAFSPRTEDEAREFGLGRSEQATPPNFTSSDESFNQAIDQCSPDSWDQLVPGDVWDSYYQLGNELLQEYGTRLDDVADEFRNSLARCLQDAGYTSTGGATDGSVEAFGVPVGSLQEAQPEQTRTEGTVVISPGTAARTYVPTLEEVNFAVSLTRCRISTGFFEAVDRQVNEAQQSVVEDHASEFSELNPQIEEAARNASTVAGN